MSAALLRQQESIVAALRARSDREASALASRHGITTTTRSRRGLFAYRSAAVALARRALAAAYPITLQLVGTENFERLARQAWFHEAPSRGDIARWGEALPELLASTPGLSNERYLPDVARIEWLLHRAANAADSSFDVNSLVLLTREDPGHLRLVLSDGAAFLASRHAAASIVLAHMERSTTLEQAADRLARGVAETAVIWRDGLRPRVRVAAEGEAAFLRSLQESRTLGDSLHDAPVFDFAAWLPLAVQSGLLLRAESTSLTQGTA